MLQYWAPRIASGNESHSEYSPLHQQRRYLLENLANEEARHEHLANMLEVNKVKLRAAQSSGEGVRTLKKSSLNLRRKIMSSQSTEKSLSQSLALITARMNYLQQTQWRRAMLEYNQSLRYGPLDGLAAGMQDMGLVSPITPGFSAAHYTSGFVSPMSPIFMHAWTSVYPAPSETYQLFSPTPTVQPSSSFLHEQLYSPLPGANTSQHGEGLDNSDATLDIDAKMSSLHLPVQDFVPAQRALSLPDISTARDLPLDNTSVEEHLEGKTFSLTRKLSLANQPSSGLRMQRKFP